MDGLRTSEISIKTIIFVSLTRALQAVLLRVQIDQTRLLHTIPEKTFFLFSTYFHHFFSPFQPWTYFFEIFPGSNFKRGSETIAQRVTAADTGDEIFHFYFYLFSQPSANQN